MTLIIIEPYWKSEFQGEQTLDWFLDRANTSVMLNGIQLPVQKAQDGTTLVHVIEGIPFSLHKCWNNVPIRRMTLVNPNSPVTEAVDGEYWEVLLDNDQDLHIDARVESYVRHGVLQQHIRVEYTNNAARQPHIGRILESLTRWYDELRAGLKNERAALPVRIPGQPAAGARREM